MRCLIFTVLSSSAIAAVAAPLSFNRDIRPILSDKCFACHGFDSKTREAGLRLDTAQGATTPNKEGGVAVVPGNPDASLLWQRISTADADDVMPPPDSHKTLSAAEKSTLRTWLEQGAPYQKHWAFEPPVRPEAGASIDDFTRAALQADGLDLAPEASREVLIRRVSMALTGLPPRLEEVDAFLADRGEGAYERMVDRYLASLHYGEEMARHWLDVARYGDTHGMHLDNERQMWAYRDWVVAAFNRNLPYDQFTIEQLAGDLLPAPTVDQLVATGFNRCNVTSGEGGSIDAEYLYRYAVDRASTTAQAWLGLTAGCAVCHDHKYDPISAREFYSLYAFFNSAADPAMDGNALLTQPVAKLNPNDYESRMAGFAARESALEKDLTARATNVSYQDPAQQQPLPPPVVTEQVWFEDGFPAGAQAGATGHPLNLVDAPVFSGKKALRRSGPDLVQDYYQAGAAPFTVPQNPVFFVHVFLDPADLPKSVMIQFHSDNWKHRAVWGQDSIEFGEKGTTSRYAAGPLPAAGQWVRLEVPGDKMGMPPGLQIMGYAFTVHGGTVTFDHLGVTGVTDPASDPALSLTAWRKERAGKDTPDAPADIQAWLKEGPEKPRTPEELQRLRDYYVTRVCTTTRAPFTPVLDQLAAVRKERSDYDAAVPSSFIFRDMPQPRDSFIMIRGQYDKPGEKVEPGTPAVLPPLQKAAARANRLDLARWLVAPENPLTARVAVNRFWQQMFGIGLVKSSHDFGSQGDVPSHPALLDWLSLWFQENRWDVRKLLRLMVTSRTFRQQSSAPEAAWQQDPENRRLARGPRFRLDAEQLRDQALYAGGLLELKLGGKGVNPYQPPDIWEPVGFGGSNTQYYKQDKGTALYRRTLYTFLKRTAPHPLLTNFDAPNREQSCIRRDRTNTPLQALQLMNDVQHYEAARGFAQRLMQQAAAPDDRIALAFRMVLSRAPSAEETGIVRDLFTRQLARYQAAPQDAARAIRAGESLPVAGADEPALAAWTMVANLILNMDEAIVRN